ncbi:hypothetical protein RvY_14698 [Ramazzottius varieornatus]|uniref:Tyrosyl-DNA phosphodiesterase 2 n=1 Tax=Ramazzottius varieornatus TaxID=947166 RepID=A0A1D1W0K5_RAMVA|nr:hypothetical protein RvY_14698 [Ramazzottius varieornatus]
MLQTLPLAQQTFVRIVRHPVSQGLAGFHRAVLRGKVGAAGGLHGCVNQQVLGTKRGVMDFDHDRSRTDDEDDGGPGGEERARRCREFRDVTSTTIPLADQYLQRNHWDLEQSVLQYFEHTASSKESVGTANGFDVIDVDALEKVRPERCQKFAELTNTTPEYAATFLPGYNYDLQAAISSFWTDLPSPVTPLERSLSDTKTEAKNEDSTDSPAKRPKKTTNPVPVNVKMEVAENSPSSSSSGDRQMEVSPKPDHDIMKRSFFKLLSWNIDGLDDKNFNQRALGVVEGIKEECPDVVFLQEVVATNLEILESHLKGSYSFITAPKADYFVAMMMHKSTVTMQKNMVVPFANTKMGRNILCAEVVWKGVSFCLATAHLESTKDGAKERVVQLRTCFDFIKTQEAEKMVILGGDLNLRDPEVGLAGGLPSSTVDLWQVCSARPECRWTWDCKRNTNAGRKCAGLSFMPQCRFDRLYYRPAQSLAKLKPVHFGLVGLKKAPRTQSFPSDHWGIVCTFDEK